MAAGQTFYKVLSEKSGALLKPTTCENCGERVENSVDLHGHHEDYSKPLEVEWLCRACHARRHPEQVAL